MNERLNLKKTVLGHDITVCAQKTGEDWSITVVGGCAPHVGSISLAEYCDGVVTVRSIVRGNHKDQVVGERFAQRVAEKGKCNVSVCCGIHYENPTQSDLTTIVTAADELLGELCAAMKL